MTRENVKKVVGIAVAVLIIVAIVIAAIPACRNAVIGLFAGEDTPATPAGPQAPVDTDADGDGDADADGNTDADAEADAEVARPFSFGGFMELALVDGMLKVPHQGATIHDLTVDEFVPESEAEKAELYAVKLRVNPYGAMTIAQEGFEAKDNHDGEPCAPVFQMCTCAEKHGAWDTDFGQFHWNAAEGNEALGPKSWTRMYGEMTEVLMDLEAREMLRAAACYWYTVDADGEQVIQYGIRVCGDQKDPELPKPVVPDNKPEDNKPVVPDNKPEHSEKPEDTIPPADDPEDTPDNTPEHTDKPQVITYAVSYKFVAKNGVRLPAAVLNLLPTAEKAEKGEKVYPKAIAVTTIKVEGGTWIFDGWDKTQVTVNGNVTFTGTWRFRENLGLADHPIADNQEELDKLGDRTDEVPEDTPNVPQHSPRPNDGTSNQGTGNSTGTGSNQGTGSSAGTGSNPSHSNPSHTSQSSDNRDKGGLTLAPTPSGGENKNETGRPALGLAPVGNSQAATQELPDDNSEVADQATQDILNSMFGPRS